MQRSSVHAKRKMNARLHIREAYLDKTCNTKSGRESKQKRWVERLEEGEINRENVETIE